MKALSFSILNWVGGAISRLTGTALLGGLILVLFGLSPGQLAAYVMQNPPAWLMSGWTRLILVILGLVIIFALLRFNVWSQRQKAIDSLSRDMSWAIHHLLNRETPKLQQQWEAYIEQWVSDYRDWCSRVNKKLEERAFFTLSDQLHFDRLGFVDPVHMTGHHNYDWWLSQLKLKFERLRDVINWAQQRPR